MYHWEPVKEEIHHLYVVQNWSLRQVMEYFERSNYWINSGEERNPCGRSYRKKLAEWNYLRAADLGGKGGAAKAVNSQPGSSKTAVNSPAPAEDPSSVSPQLESTSRLQKYPDGLAPRQLARLYFPDVLAQNIPLTEALFAKTPEYPQTDCDCIPPKF